MGEPVHEPWTVPEARAVTLASGAQAVVDQILDRRSRTAPEAWTGRLAEDELRTQAAEIDRRLADGEDLPLAGVPFAVKDNIDVAGVPTTAACAAFANVPGESAWVVQQLLAAGGIYVGKTNLDQFATGLVGTRSPHYGVCRNPFDDRFIVGGSSAGSALAVASGEVPLALGTDTAGSGRVPAALCGIVGTKPTRGLVSTDGVVPAMASFDCVSWFTADVDDGATVFDVLMGERPLAAVPTRLGVPTGIDWCGDDDARQLFDRALDELRARGFTIVDVDGAVLRQAGAMLYGSALTAERHLAFGEFAAAHPDEMEPGVAEIVAAAGRHDLAAYVAARAALVPLQAQAALLFHDIDALVLPTVARVPTVDEALTDRLGPSLELGRLTAFVNPLGFAAISVPAGARDTGVPFGISFVGPAGSDRSLLALAGADASPRPCSIAVVGAHLSGQPLNHQLTDLGAVLTQSTTTAPGYRLYALETTPPKPGLVRVAESGAAIELEVWSISERGLGAFVHAIPAPLGVGKVELADGSEVTGFLCEPLAVEGAAEITHHGGWRAYLASRG